MVLVRSNTEMLKAEEAKAQETHDEALKKPTSMLAQYVLDVWADALESKETVEDIMEASIRQRNGTYSDGKLEEIRKQGGSEIYMMLTDEKSTALKAWIYDLLLPPNDNPYDIAPTPVPELPEDQMEMIEQHAQVELIQSLMEQQQLGTPISEEEIASKMEAITADIKLKIREYAENFDSSLKDKIDDMLIEASWREAFAEVIDDVVDLPAGVLKGPIVENGKELAWEQDVDGKYKPVVEDALKLKYHRVSPFDIYPVGASTGIEDGDLFEKHRLTIKQIAALKGVEGYDNDSIDAILLDAPTGSLSNWTDPDDEIHTSRNKEQQEDETTDDWFHNYGKKIEALQFWGAIPGHMLYEWGVKGVSPENLLDIYDAEIWVIGDYVIKAKINSHPLGMKPYYKASFRKRNGSFWGEGLPQILKDIQDMCNAAARSLVNNMAISSGPQVGMDLSRLAEGQNVTTIFPWKIWQFDESSMTQAGGRPPLWFFQPDSNSHELMQVYEFFSKEADNKTGIPRYTYGSGGSAAALGTATGMSMMMNNASKGVKQVVKNIDDGLITPSVKAAHTHIMIWDEDEALKGDIKIKASGSASLVAKEQMQVRLNEALNIAMSPIGLQILGEEGLAVLLKDVFEGLGPNIESIVPTAEQIKERQALQQQQMMEMAQQPQMGQDGRAVDNSGAIAGGGDVNMFQQKPIR